MSDTICIDRERWERVRLFAGRMQLRHLTEPLTPLSYIGGELDALHNGDLDPIEPADNPALPRPIGGYIEYPGDRFLHVDQNEGGAFDWEFFRAGNNTAAPEIIATGTAPGIWGAMVGAQAAMIHATVGEPNDE